MSDIFLLIIFSLIVGFVGSLVGLGGGIIITPVLTIILGIDIKYAIGTSIIAVIATSSGSAITFLKDEISNIKIGVFLEVFTTIGGIIGALLSGVLSTKLLYFFFSLILTNAFYGMIKKSGLIKNLKIEEEEIIEDFYAKKLNFSSSYFDKSENKVINYKVTNVSKGSLIMFGAGIASGLLGIGSGTFKVIAFDNYMKLPIKVSTATSNFMMGVTACSSALIYFFNGSINPYIAAPVALGTLIGARLGAKVMQNINSNYIRIIFLPILFFTIMSMLLKAVGVL